MKKSLLKSILFIIAMTGLFSEKNLAQTPSWQWAYSAGSTGSEITTATALDASGNLFATGWYTSAGITFGTNTFLNQGSFTGDIFLVKYNPTGTVLWAKSFGAADGELCNGTTTDAVGNVYITGLFTSPTLAIGSVTLVNSSIGSSDVFIAKIDPTGNTVWAKSAGGTQSDRGNSIAVDALGNVFTTGGFNSSAINFGTGALTNFGSATSDFFIVKHDVNGNTLWARSTGGSNSDAGHSAATDSLGNIYVTGAFSSSSINFGLGAMLNSASGTQDLFIVKYDASGITNWSVRSGGSLDDYGNSIAVRSNNVYVTGGFNSSSIAFGTSTLTNISAGTSDVLLVKYDLNGSVAWAKKAGGSDSEVGNAVAADSAGNVYISGFFSSTSIGFGTATINNAAVGYRDLFVAAYDVTGNTSWATTSSGGIYDETAYALSVNATGNAVYTGGTFNSGTVVFGSTTLYKGCGDDVFVAKLLGPMVGIKEENFNKILLVYPNPATEKIYLNEEGEIMMFNSIGQVVLKEIINGKKQLDVAQLPKGIYVLKILFKDNKTKIGRVVLE